jgi:alkanesulfonate monooxygenase SsuD/methylene tetrahydromethanopterin reductase-like flavin-dependent oxidoreductase (luciferase family)
VEIVRKVASGERVAHEGKHYRGEGLPLTSPPPKAPVRVYLAALGPEMLELAGEIADGVLLNWIPPEAVPASISHLETGARRAGRTLEGFEIASFVRTCVTDDAPAARETLARDITGYATVGRLRLVLPTAGLPDEVGAVGAAWSRGRPRRRREARLAADARRARRGRRRGVLPRAHRGVRAGRHHPAGDRAVRAAGADRASLLRTLRTVPGLSRWP